MECSLVACASMDMLPEMFAILSMAQATFVDIVTQFDPLISIVVDFIELLFEQRISINPFIFSS